MSTIQDVARHAHVGVGTVSRVLNGNGYVKESTREKVEKAIKELNYTPNEMAKNLFFHRNGIVAVIVPKLSHPFFAEFADAAEEELCKYGFQMMLCNTWNKENNEQTFLEMLKQKRVDGLIMGAHTLDVSAYHNIDRPIVALDREIGFGIPCVSVDHASGGRMAAEEIVRAGCKEVVQMASDEMVIGPFRSRHSEFEKVLKKNGILCHNYVMEWNAFDNNHYAQAAKEIMDLYPDADGYFGTDIGVLNIIRSAQERGKCYPDEFKAVAYDGTGLSELCYPRLTTIAQPIEKLAKECVRLVVNQIRGEKAKEEHVLVNVELRTGDSTKPFIKKRNKNVSNKNAE